MKNLISAGLVLAGLGLYLFGKKDSLTKPTKQTIKGTNANNMPPTNEQKQNHENITDDVILNDSSSGFDDSSNSV